MRYSWILILALFFAGCSHSKHVTKKSAPSKGLTKILKNPDYNYKLRMAEQYFVKKRYSRAQQVYEDIMPYFKASKEFEDIYYKYAYCAYYQDDYMNAENLFKSYLEIFPNSSKAEE